MSRHPIESGIHEHQHSVSEDDRIHTEDSQVHGRPPEEQVEPPVDDHENGEVRRWNHERPHTLVIACSDGRFQKDLDDFLHRELGIDHYDRLYIPGGPGGLAPTGIEFSRSHQLRTECRFLIAAHGIEHTVLVFHGPAAGGPDEAVCGDYRRKLPRASAHEIRLRQEQDAGDVLASGLWTGVDVVVYRCEVTADNTVTFVRVR
jgi:hypothetical protein